MPQNWATAADGGYMANVPLSQKLRYQAMGKMVLAQLTTPVDGAFGKEKGEKIQYLRLNRVDTKGGKIAEKDFMPQTKQVISRGEVVVDEWGNSIEFSGKLETLSNFDPTNTFQRGIMDDQAEVLDEAVRDVLRTGAVVATPITNTTITWAYAGAPGATVAASLSVEHLRLLKQRAKELHIAPFDDQGNYLLIGGPGVMASLTRDTDWKYVADYADPERWLNGEAGRLLGVRCLEETESLLSTGFPVNNTSTYAGEAYFVGREAIAEAMALPPELRYQSDDYGRQKGLAWYCIAGYGNYWDGTTSWSTSTDARGRVRYIRVDGT